MKLILNILLAVLAYYTPDDALHMTRSYTSPGDEPYTELTTEAGRRCVYIPDGKFLYFRITDNAVPATMNNLKFVVTYLDRGQGEMRLQYTATNNRNYESVVAGKSNTGEWLTATLAVTDASLRDAQNHGYLRINAGNYIARVEIQDGVMDPMTEAVTQPLGGSAYSEFIGKSVAGYQAWFKVGGQYDFWHHWGNDAVAQDGTRWPRAYNHTFEIYPDVSMYDDQDLYQTGFANLGNGEPARLYNGQSPRVVAKHFEKMQEVGIDGVAVQRFLGAEMRTVVNNPSAQIAVIRQQAEARQRIFYICYDITSNGLDNTWMDLIRFDWVYNVEQNYCLTASPSYATVNGKPVVEIWGAGFGDRPGTEAQVIALVNWFKQRGCYVIGGVPTYWREGRNDSRSGFMNGYLSFDMLSPWLVGRFSNHNEAQYFFGLEQQDKAFCDQHQIDYMPVLFAGFGWATWNPGSLNQAPRLAGEFLTEQAVAARQAGCENLYFAMFDEYDEGTALLSMATDYTMIPTDAYFLTSSADGVWLSSDYYLRLAGAISHSQTPLQGTLRGVPYSLGPVYYRNSFESRDTWYDYQNGVAQRFGTFPIDPCLPADHDAALSIVKHHAHSGDYALQVSAPGTYTLGTICTTKTAAELKATAYIDAPDGVSVTLALTQTPQAPLQGELSALALTLTVSAPSLSTPIYLDDLLVEDNDEVLSTNDFGLSTPVKVLRDGRIYLVTPDRTYDVLGRQQ